MSQTLQSVLCITTNKYLVRVLVVLLHACFSVVSPIPFLLAAIFFSGHPYIGSTTVLPDTSNKNFILKYFRCRDGKRTETRIGMEGICITHSCIPLYTVYIYVHATHNGSQWWNAGMGNTDTLHPNSCFSIPTSEIF